MQGEAGAPRRVVVVGAGICGVSAALWLQRDGHEVTVLDPLPPGEGTSFGNAGGIVVSSCAPVALPGIWREVPRLLRDPQGALRIRWSCLPRLAPWLLKLLAASSPERVERIARARASLLRDAAEAWQALLREAGAERLVDPVGWVEAFSTDAGFAHSETERRLMRANGLSFQTLDADELRQLEPALGPVFRHAIFQPDALAVRHPQRVVQAFAQAFAAAGGRVLGERVVRIAGEPGARRVITDAGAHPAEAVVVAAGPWSGRVTAMLDEKVSLDTERGYHLMLPTPAENLRRPVVWCEHSFVLCPMLHGVRLTSGEELASVDAPPDYRPIHRLLPLAARMLRGLDTASVRSEWMGRRPSMPDSLPVLGRSRRHPDVFHAFGHGHVGMTLGPVSGRVVADLVAGRTPEIDLAPFTPR